MRYRFFKLLTTVSLLVCAPMALADFQSNWLAGFSAGKVWHDSTLYTNATGRNPFNISFDYDENGFIWGVFTGYQMRCNGWLVGGEFNLDWDRTQHFHDMDFVISTSNNRIRGGQAFFDGQVKFHRQATVGLSARVGFEPHPFLLPYVRLGVEASKDKLMILADNNIIPLHIDGEGGRRSYRIVAGIGLEIPMPVIMGLSGRIEYDYHSKGRKSEVFAVASDNATIVVGDIAPRTNSVKASFVWNFV